MKKIAYIYCGLNIHLKLVPLLLFYSLICIVLAPEGNVADEGRYLMFANNLLNGFYSSPFPNINVWNGPGYPMLLSAFMFLKLPFLGLRILNGFLLYFSLVFTYKSLNFYFSRRKAFVYTLLAGMYFPIFLYLPLLMTECITWFLISLICYLLVSNFRQTSISWKLVLLSCLAIAFLAMTKVIFGYVIVSMILLSIVALFFSHFRLTAKKSLLIFLLSIILCLPWLIYTYNLTGKVFYWANSGNMSLYTMSTPYAGETGEWYPQEQLLKNPNHTAFINSISGLTPLQKDNAYKAEAIKNITSHPLKYFSNCISNIGRLLFFPSDLAPKTTLAYYPFIPNIFMTVFITISVLLSIRYYKRIPPELIFLLLFVIIYLSGSILVTAYRRMFYITMPFWTILIAYVFNHIISINVWKDQYTSK